MQIGKTLLIATFIAFNGACAVAQTIPPEATFNRIFDCGWLMMSENDRNQEQTETMQFFLGLKIYDAPRNGIPPYRHPFRALGTQFDQLSFAGANKGAILELQGSKASYEVILKYFASQNRPLVQALKQMLPAQAGARLWTRSEIGPDSTLQFIVLEGMGGLDEVKRTPGATTACIVEETSPEDLKTLGLDTLHEVQRIVDAKLAMPPAWANAIIKSGSMLRMRRLASYIHLTDEQITGLLAINNNLITTALIQNLSVKLTTDQIDSLISKIGTASEIALNRLSQLSEPQRRKVMAIIPTATRNTLTLREPGAAADDLLMRIIDQNDRYAVIGAFREHYQPNNQHIDRVLASPSAELRTDFTMNVKFKPTAAQIEQILNDPVPQVRIGLLRRYDVEIPNALISKGINHPEENLRFWYGHYRNYTPTPTEIETGLTHLDTPTRRSWLMRENITLTQAQINRGFEDKETRWALVQRSDLKLPDELIERCITSDAFQVRDACVNRPDFEVTQSRFDTLMRDKNPNIRRSLVSSSRKRQQDLSSFVTAVFEQGNSDILIGMASSGLVFTDAQLAAGSKSSDPKVRYAFCMIIGSECKR